MPMTSLVKLANIAQIVTPIGILLAWSSYMSDISDKKIDRTLNIMDQYDSAINKHTRPAYDFIVEFNDPTTLTSIKKSQEIQIDDKFDLNNKTYRYHVKNGKISSDDVDLFRFSLVKLFNAWETAAWVYCRNIGDDEMIKSYWDGYIFGNKNLGKITKFMKIYNPDAWNVLYENDATVTTNVGNCK